MPRSPSGTFSTACPEEWSDRDDLRRLIVFMGALDQFMDVFDALEDSTLEGATLDRATEWAMKLGWRID